MNRIVQDIPNFVEGATPKRDTFETQDELLALPWVARWVSEPFDGVPFYGWEVSTCGHTSPLLMAVYHGGVRWRWWVVGRLDSLEGVTLPEWSSR